MTRGLPRSCLEGRLHRANIGESAARRQAATSGGASHRRRGPRDEASIGTHDRRPRLRRAGGAVLYLSPALPDVARRGLDWPIWLDHPEGTSLTTYGKWWVLPPHHYLSDGSSGDFPVYIYYLSDSLINLIAELERARRPSRSRR